MFASSSSSSVVVVVVAFPFPDISALTRLSVTPKSFVTKSKVELLRCGEEEEGGGGGGGESLCVFSLFPFLGSPFLPPCVWVASSVFSPSSRSFYSSFSPSLFLPPFISSSGRDQLGEEEEEEEDDV